MSLTQKNLLQKISGHPFYNFGAFKVYYKKLEKVIENLKSTLNFHSNFFSMNIH